MSFSHIKNELMSKLDSISEIQEVHDYPTNDFNGFPACVIVTMGNESDYQSRQDNERHYVFEVTLLQESEDTDIRQARRIIEGLIDIVMDNFDSDEYLNSVTMPAKKVLIGVEPALSEIIEAEKYCLAVMTLTARVLYDVT